MVLKLKEEEIKILHRHIKKLMMQIKTNIWIEQEEVKTVHSELVNAIGRGRKQANHQHFFKEEDKKRGRTNTADKEIEETQRKIDVLSQYLPEANTGDYKDERYPGGQRKKPKKTKRITGTPAKEDTDRK